MIREHLPRGFAWLIPKNGFLSKLIAGIELELERVKAFLAGVILEANPGTAIATQEEWYQQYGIKFDSTTSLADQQATTLERYTSIGGQDIVYIQDSIDKAGYTGITVFENAPLTGDSNNTYGTAICGLAQCATLSTTGDDWTTIRMIFTLPDTSQLRAQLLLNDGASYTGNGENGLFLANALLQRYPIIGGNLFQYSSYPLKHGFTELRADIIPYIYENIAGQLKASGIIEDTTAANTHAIFKNYSIDAGQKYTFFFDVKKKGRDLMLRLADQSGSESTYDIIFDIDNLIVTYPDGVTGYIKNAGNDFVRCAVTFQYQLSTLMRIVFYLYDGSSFIYNGDGVSGLILDKYQLNEGELEDYISSIDSFTSRADKGTYYADDGLLRTAAIDVARFQYDPADLNVEPFLLLEDARENTISSSNVFDSGDWSNVNIDLNSGAGVGPDGNLSFYKMIPTSVNGQHRIQQDTSIAFADNEIVVASIFLKADELSDVRLSIGAKDGGFPGVYFDINTKTFQSVASPLDFNYIDCGNNIFRLWVVANVATGGTIPELVLWVTNGTNVVFSGDNISGLFIFGAQLESGRYPTSYIPSVETFVSRASTGTYFDSNGIIQTAAVDVERITYNPENLLAEPVQLFEDEATNELLHSNDFNNAAWTLKQNISISSGVDDPFGGTTAFTITATNNTALLGQVIVDSIGQSFAGSLWIKRRNGNGTIRLIVGDNVTVNINVTDQWQRLFASNTISTVTCRFYIGINTINDSIDILNTQLEKGLFPTSYIPTEATAVTRAADIFTSATGSRAADVSSSQSIPATPTDNLISSPNDFDSVDWTKLNSSVIPDALFDKDGNKTADKLIEDETTGQHAIYQDINIADTERQYLLQLDVKRSEVNDIEILLEDLAGDPFQVSATFDILELLSVPVGDVDSFIFAVQGNWIFYYNVVGTVDVQEDIVNVRAILQRIAPGHLIPIFDISVKGNVYGPAVCGVAFCDG